ncbi:MAG: biliverdin-producing heme oxygenase [Bryobacteraceae bacterium]|nr:biliverdin-producing heme oxygenase [Bryobacteraceae bacterium]
MALLGRLRTETAASHRALEECVDIAACLSTREEWLWLHESFLGYWAPLEALLFSSSDLERWLPDAGLRRKTALLRLDIDSLGGISQHLTYCQELPPLASIAQKLGCLYVLEGSTLGGQRITQMAAGCGYAAPEAGRFFRSYGPQVGSMWKTFGERLEAYALADPDSHEIVVGSAFETFTRLSSWVATKKTERSRHVGYSPYH